MRIGAASICASRVLKRNQPTGGPPVLGGNGMVVQRPPAGIRMERHQLSAARGVLTSGRLKAGKGWTGATRHLSRPLFVLARLGFRVLVPSPHGTVAVIGDENAGRAPANLRMDGAAHARAWPRERLAKQATQLARRLKVPRRARSATSGLAKPAEPRRLLI